MVELLFGIDDAGRGPVIGPMILAGCIIDKKYEAELKEAGVKDSKLLTQKKREELETKIKEVAHSYSVKITMPDTITDTNLAGLKLNELEALECAKIINELNVIPDKMFVVLDCPSPNLEAWGNYLKIHVKKLDNLTISSEHKADFNHISAGCASILAKCERERQMDKLKDEYGEGIGSGYPGDPKTKAFLAKYAKKYADRNLFRKTWATYIRAVEGENQATLF
ncbi:MAG: ribonuclease HII [Nanoarchaeota archaeon]|jgi:ribonuclease HII|nr:ribonuclease HII [Nanoarchaeota archaeon]